MSYTPTTQQVEDGFAHEPEYEFHNPVGYGSHVQSNRRAFNRWLAALIREAKAEALNEAAEHVAEQSVRYADTASRLHDEGEWVDSSRYSNYAAGVSMALTTLRARAAEYRKAVES